MRLSFCIAKVYGDPRGVESKAAIASADVIAILNQAIDLIGCG